MIRYGSLVLSFVIALVVSLSLTPLVRRIALERGIVDQPGGRKVHRKPIPCLGGVAIYLGVMVALLAAFQFDPLFKLEFGGYLTGFVMGGAIIVVIGLIDDVKGTRASIKFLGQILAALVLFHYGFRIESIANPFGGSLHFPIPLSAFITILWIVVLTNAFNLIDGLDGLAAGIAFIASCILLAVGLSWPRYLVAFLAIAIMGSSLGFLKYNFYPARIFMGDTGSMFLGFVFGAMSTLGIGKGATIVSLMIPLAVLAIPVYDTIVAVIRRIARKTPVFIPDKEHLHHRLLEMGLSHKQVVLLLYFVSIYLGLMGFLFNFVPSRYAFMLIILIIMGVFGAIRVLGFMERQIRGQRRRK